ncbi:MAG TPA: hypothetical protein VNL98_05970 [Gemmatimonadales bacterium]|nr:hypothetical protein [Gemmatimonadales bacterium]
MSGTSVHRTRDGRGSGQFPRQADRYIEHPPRITRLARDSFATPIAVRRRA